MHKFGLIIFLGVLSSFAHTKQKTIEIGLASNFSEISSSSSNPYGNYFEKG